MRTAPDFELPDELQDDHRTAVRLTWIQIAFLLSGIVLLYFVKGNSQALKTAWLDDMLALIPPIVFLISSRFTHRSSDPRHPYGFHRAPTLAFLVSAVALLGLGTYLAIEAAIKLVRMEHPSVGTIALGGAVVWIGYAAAVVMAYKVVGGTILGRMKVPLAKRMHNKVLFADATMMRADWMTSAGAAAGVLLVGAGWWWADGVAALIISVSIIHDGLTNVGAALGDLMDRHPETVERKPDDVVERVHRELEASPLVHEAAVRMRENGQVFYGEAYVVPFERDLTTDELHELSRRCEELDWRIHELTVAPVREIDPSEGS